MILLIDNYDSFTYNLYQMIGIMNPDITVLRNDALSVDEILCLQPEAIVISPGPGRPENAGVCVEAIRRLDGSVPLLGVCLGHQAICLAYGGKVSSSRILMHGKPSKVTLDSSCPLFQGIPEEMMVGRYHSLAALDEGFPSQLQVVARSDDGEIMALQHREYPVYGLQFHPESILTPKGDVILKNFLERGRRA